MNQIGPPEASGWKTAEGTARTKAHGWENIGPRQAVGGGPELLAGMPKVRGGKERKDR